VTAPTKRFGTHLREVDHQMVLAALDGERRARNGDAADAALCYTRACALAAALRHVWEGLGDPDDPEAARYGGLQGHYALRATACADRPRRSAGPPPTLVRVDCTDLTVCDWCGQRFAPHGDPAGAGYCSPECLAAAEEAAGIGEPNACPGDVAARDTY
jgi:hypothetical protein